MSTRDIDAIVRSAGLKRTPSRVAVVRTLAKSGRPMSHPEVMNVLSAHGFGRATVYRNLLDLTKVGILRRSDHGDHVWRYELTTRDHANDHLHFVCTDCGSISCLPRSVTVVIRGSTDAPRAVRAREVAVQLSGLCNGCAERA